MRVSTALIRAARLALPLAVLLGLLPACAQREIVKGDVLRVARRTLPSAGESFRLAPSPPDRLVLHRVALCPVQERRTYQEVEVETASAAVAGAAGVGCGVQKFSELTNRLYHPNVVNESSCGGTSFTRRRPTGRAIEGEWLTVRREPCGAPRPVSPGGALRLDFLQSREVRSYAVGEEGGIRLGKDTLTRLRLYLTILRGVEIEARYGGAKWRQKIDLE